MVDVTTETRCGCDEAGRAKTRTTVLAHREGFFKIHQRDAPIGPQQDVTWVKITKDDSPAVELLDRPLELTEDFQGPPGVRGDLAARWIVVQQRVARDHDPVEWLAVDVLLDQEVMFPAREVVDQLRDELNVSQLFKHD